MAAHRLLVGGVVSGRADPIYDAALPIADARKLPRDHPGTWLCRCGAMFIGQADIYPDSLYAHARFRAEDEPGPTHDPGLRTHSVSLPIVGRRRSPGSGAVVPLRRPAVHRDRPLRSTTVRVVSYCACGTHVIDLSPAAFAELAPLDRGVVAVVIERVAVGRATPPPTDTSAVVP